MTNNKNQKGKFHVRIYLKDIFVFNEQQKRGTFAFGCNFTLTRNTVNSVLNKANATIVLKFKIDALEWYVPHYTPSIPQQAMLTKLILSRKPTEIQYVEKSSFVKEANTQNIWTFELGTQEAINVPICIFV